MTAVTSWGVLYEFDHREELSMEGYLVSNAIICHHGVCEVENNQARALHESPPGLGPNGYNRLVALFPVLKTKKKFRQFFQEMGELFTFQM